MLISIPLSTFSAKQIRHKYPDEVIRLRKDDFLNTVILSRRINSINRAKLLLNTSLTFDIGYRIDMSRSGLLKIGHQIHTYHVDQMIRFLAGVKFANHPPFSAIREYCLSMDITEDDIDYSSLYRAWQRKKEIIAKKPTTSVASDSQVFPYTDDEVMAALAIANGTRLYNCKNHFKIARMNDLKIFMDMQLHDKHPSTIARKYGCHISTVYRCAEKQLAVCKH